MSISDRPDAVVRKPELVRRLTPDLQRRVDGLADAAQSLDGVRAFGEHKWLRLVRGDDRCTALLVWDGSQLIAAAHCDAYHTRAPDRPCRLTSEMVVHPAHRGHGVGTSLLHAVNDLACQEVAQDLHLWAYGNLAPARSLAAAFGYHAERLLLEYTLCAERLPEPPRLPPDVRLRSFQPARDAEDWLELHNRVFAGHPEQGNWDTADLYARFDTPWFDARDLLVAEDARAMIGFCWVKLPRESTAPGEIYIVGVNPSARGRSLGRLLTQAGLAHIRRAGRPGATLYVEADNAPARAMYERLGFELRWEHTCYQRQVSR